MTPKPQDKQSKKELLKKIKDTRWLTVGLLKSSASEAMAFIEAGNMLQAAGIIAALYYDCDDVQKRISSIAERTTT